MKTKHTRGPWFAGKPFYHHGERQRVTPINAQDPTCVGGQWLIAWCHQNAVPAKEVAPNARLIAAAPELLEAAMQADCGCSVAERDSGHRPECWMPALAAAIAKATGMAANYK